MSSNKSIVCFKLVSVQLTLNCVVTQGEPRRIRLMLDQWFKQIGTHPLLADDWDFESNSDYIWYRDEFARSNFMDTLYVIRSPGINQLSYKEIEVS